MSLSLLPRAAECVKDFRELSSLGRPVPGSGSLRARGGHGRGLGMCRGSHRPRQRALPRGCHRLPVPQCGIPTRLASPGSSPREPGAAESPVPAPLPGPHCPLHPRMKPFQYHGCHTVLAQLGFLVCTWGFLQGRTRGRHPYKRGTCRMVAWQPWALEGPLLTSWDFGEQAPWAS